MINSDLVVGVSSLLIGGIVYFVTRDLSHFGGVFVNYVLTVLCFLSVVEIIKGFIKPEYIRFFESVAERNNIFIGIAMLAVYLFFLPLVGFLPSSFVFYAAMSLYLTEERSTKTVVQCVLMSAVVVSLFYVVFKLGLEVPLPKGEWLAS